MFATLLTLIVAAVHFYFLYLEMVKWEAPRTRAVFGTTAEFAAASRVMAANQGLYNGFVGGGLIVGMLFGAPVMVIYLLLCAAGAGVYALMGGIRAAIYVQTVPAVLALLAFGLGL